MRWNDLDLAVGAAPQLRHLSSPGGQLLRPSRRDIGQEKRNGSPDRES
jgi:hypothetical protein